MPKEVSPTRKQLLGRIERMQRDCIMKKLGIKKEEWPEDTLDRLFFITNSEAFKL